MRVIAFIYARMSSKRLPGKVLTKFYDTPLIKIIADKLYSIGIEPIVLTSDIESDDELVKYCNNNGISVFRGNLEDVSKRTIDALNVYKCDYFFRVNGDSPFLQSELIEESMQILSNEPGKDLYTNILKRTFPYGIALELIKTNSLNDNYKNFSEYNKEHITSYFYENHSKFKIRNIENFNDLSTYSLTIDTARDLNIIENLIDFFKEDNIFNLPLDELITKLITYNSTNPLTI